MAKCWMCQYLDENHWNIMQIAWICNVSSWRLILSLKEHVMKKTLFIDVIQKLECWPSNILPFCNTGSFSSLLFKSMSTIRSSYCTHLLEKLVVLRLHKYFLFLSKFSSGLNFTKENARQNFGIAAGCRRLRFSNFEQKKEKSLSFFLCIQILKPLDTKKKLLNIKTNYSLQLNHKMTRNRPSYHNMVGRNPLIIILFDNCTVTKTRKLLFFVKKKRMLVSYK